MSSWLLLHQRYRIAQQVTRGADTAVAVVAAVTITQDLTAGPAPPRLINTS